ncbi:ABC transporter permease [Actinomadura atramentaria]|uniref:ABC transporter permease n=1 Tax=Actinomadura atramentaria TaxID=1990 RepID=UPI0003601FED|nr:FtsX-like permease family protein [Actinomadura atramentaria]
MNRATLRIARRDAARSPGRTLLVLAMIALPVTVIVAFAVLARTADWSPRESLPNNLGTADARLSGVDRVPIEQFSAVDPTGYQRTADTEQNGTAPGAEPNGGTATGGANGGAARGGATGGVAVTGGEAGGGAEGGEGDGDVRPWSDAEVARVVAGRFGDGARVVPVTTGGQVEVRTPRGVLGADLTQLDLRDPLTRGMASVTAGRAPVASDEIALSREFEERGFRIGSTVRVGPKGEAKRLTGFVSLPRAAGPVAVAPPGAFPAGREGRTEWLLSAGHDVSWADVRSLNGAGFTVLSRAVVLHPPSGLPDPPGSGTRGSDLAVVALAVAMIILEVVLLAGPSFAVGVQRRRRDLALLAAAGGTPGHLRAVVVAGGAVLGTAGALLGVAAGIGVAAVAATARTHVLDHAPLGPFDVPWLPVALTAALGAVSGLLAALVPALQAARTDVAAALAGRRDRARSRAGRPIIGGVLVAAGTALSLGGIGPLHELAPALGAAAIIVGCVLATPWLVGLAGRVAGALPLPLRLAVRDGARNRGRAAPAVAAITAAVAGITVLAIGGASDAAQERREYRPQLPYGSALVRVPDGRVAATRDAIGRELADAPVTPMRTLPGEGSECHPGTECPFVSFAVKQRKGQRTIVLDTVVGGPREARLLLGRDDPRIAAALTAGKVVLFDAARPGETTTAATVSVYRNDMPHTLRTVRRLPALAVAEDPHVAVIVPPAVARRVGLPVTVTAFGVDRADHRTTRDEQERLTERVAGIAGTADDGSVYVERGYTGGNGRILLLLALAAAALALGGSLLATGLAAADSRPDLATLAAIGAKPRTRRLLLMGQAAFVAVLGCWLGVAAGFVPGLAVAIPLTADTTGGAGHHGTIIDVPWTVLGAVVVVVPAVAALVAGLFGRGRLPLVRRATG